MTIRVVVADDQDLVRMGLTAIIDAQNDMEVVGEAANGTRAVALAQELRPDVCLFDIRMPQLDGIEATAQLAGAGVADPLAVVVITTFDLDEYVHSALKAGARGFCSRTRGLNFLSRPSTQRPEVTRSLLPVLRPDSSIGSLIWIRWTRRLNRWRH